MTDTPKEHDQTVRDDSLPGRIRRREFLKVAGLGAVGGAVVGSLFDGGLAPSASAQESGDAASRAASAAAAMAKRKPGVKLRMLQPFYTLGAIKPVAEQWTKETGIPVAHIEIAGESISQKLLQEAATKSGAFDIALAVTHGVPDFAESGAFVDLTEFAKQYNPDRDAKGCHALYNVGDFYQGRLYGLCADGDTYLMFYRKDLLDNTEEQKRFADGSAISGSTAAKLGRTRSQ